jgi:hypothetical protein
MERGLLVYLPKQRAPGSPDAARTGIDTHRAESRQVDLHPLVARRLPRVTVTAALHRDQQTVGTGEIHSGLDVRHVERLHDQRRMLVK